MPPAYCSMTSCLSLVHRYFHYHALAVTDDQATWARLVMPLHIEACCCRHTMTVITRITKLVLHFAQISHNLYCECSTHIHGNHMMH